MAHILQGISKLVAHPLPNLLDHYQSATNNRINAVGDALEEYVKDLFANTIDETNLEHKLIKYDQVFSWQGGKNNPPDLIIRNGDAIEVKKISSLNSQIALNSSSPKSKLLANDPMISSNYRECENWLEKI